MKRKILFQLAENLKKHGLRSWDTPKGTHYFREDVYYDSDLPLGCEAPEGGYHPENPFCYLKRDWQDFPDWIKEGISLEDLREVGIIDEKEEKRFLCKNQPGG